jgi:hypothetical protein
LSAISAVNFIQHVFDVGLGPVLAETLAYYRKLTSVIDLPLSLFSLHISQPAKDAFVFVALTLTAFHSAHRGTESWTTASALHRVLFRLLPFAIACGVAWAVESQIGSGMQLSVFFVASFFVFGLMVPIALMLGPVLLYEWLQGRKPWDQGGEIFIGYARNLLYIAAIVVFIFATNWM